MHKACWMVLLPGCRPFPMVGTKCSEDEALAYARGIWPNAEVH